MREIEKKLIVLLDPFGNLDEDQFRFVDGDVTRLSGLKQLFHPSRVYIVHFSRGKLWRNILLRWCFRFRKNINVRIFLYKNDGLLSSFFATKDSGAYSTFAKAHLPVPASFKNRLIAKLPMMIQATDNYLVLSHHGVCDGAAGDADISELKLLNFLFFSNVDGKLLLLNGDSFQTGNGVIAKTTMNPTYLNVMAKEFATLQLICDHSEKKNLTPAPLKHIRTKKYEFFLEEYIQGRGLREVLRDPQVCMDQNVVCGLIDQLDNWFKSYRKGFSGSPVSFQELYKHLFKSFRSFNSDDQEMTSIADKNWSMLQTLDTVHPGLTPVTAHNDLWPGNFVLTSERLVAVDWERATFNCSEFFDYFWLIISATLEYLVGVCGHQDYSLAFREFLILDDPVCIYARKKLKDRLVYNNIPEDKINLFYSLFLMEWSIQGWLVLDRQTVMDKLAAGELLSFTRRRQC